MTIAAEPFVEEPFWFGAGDEELFGVFVDPGDVGEATADVAVLLVTGGGPTPSMHRNRMFVRLARLLAQGGFASLRFDFHGKGESTGSVDHFRLERPFSDDVLGAVAYLRQRGFSRLVLVGTCFGARSILAASGQIADIAGVALLAAPVRDRGAGKQPVQAKGPRARLAETQRRYARIVLKRAPQVRSRLRAARRNARREPGNVSPAYLKPLEALVSREVPLLLMHGRDDQYYADFVAGLAGPLGKVLKRAEPHLQAVTTEGNLHSFATIAAQDLAIATALEWVTGLPDCARSR